ncbi:hypothetical protein V6N13_046364 [Hibiscus sabdariffa]
MCNFSKRCNLCSVPSVLLSFFCEREREGEEGEAATACSCSSVSSSNLKSKGEVSSKVVDDFIDGGVGLLTRLEPTTEYLVVKNGGGTGRGTAGESNSGEGVSGR